MDAGTDYFTNFKRVMWVGIALNVFFGLWLWFSPASLLGVMGIDQPAPLTWARYAGLAMVVVGLFYLPAALSPLHNRFIAAMATVSRGLFSLFFLFSTGILWLPALYEAVFAVLQGTTFWRGWRADLMAKP